MFAGPHHQDRLVHDGAGHALGLGSPAYDTALMWLQLKRERERVRVKSYRGHRDLGIICNGCKCKELCDVIPSVMERFKGSSAVVSNWRWSLRTHIIFTTQFWVATRQLRNILYTVRHSVFIL